MQSELLADLTQFLKEKTATFRLLVLIVFLLFILTEVIMMTKFIWHYNYYLDYGKMLQNLCKDAYTEYETPRFQLYDKSETVMMKADEFSQENVYNTMMLVAVIIIVLYLAVLFAYVYLYICVDGFKNVRMAEWNDMSNYIDWNWIIWVHFIIAIYFIIIILIYVPLKLTNIVDIFPFQMENAQLIVHFIVMFIIGCFLFWNIQKEQGFFNGVVMAFLLVFSYSLACFILSAICNAYLKSKIISQSSDFKNQYIPNDDPYSLPEDLYQDFFLNILGFKTISKEPLRIYTYDKFIFILFIIFSFFCLIALILYTMKRNGAYDVFFYVCLIPFSILFIIALMGKMHIEYNTYVNKYLLFLPEVLYKRILLQINNIFNKLLINDKSNILDKSVCFNIANAIHLSIYTDLFKQQSVGIDDASKTKVNNDIKSLFKPAFKFTRECDDSAHIDYNQIESYNINYYINDNQNMFYTNNKDCSNIRNGLLYILMFNCIRTNGDERSNTFQKWLRYTIDNVYNQQKHYAGDAGGTDFEDVKIKTDLSTLASSEVKFNPHIEGVIANVSNEYDKFLWKMHLEVVKTVRALCKCNGLPDITSSDAIFKSQLLDYILKETDGTYSKSIKKDFINVFVTITSDFLAKINQYLSSQLVENNHNNRLAKLIIRNYNRTQGQDTEDGFNKFIGSKLKEEENKTPVNPQKSMFHDPFLHIDEIEKITSNIVFDNKDEKAADARTKTQNFKNEYELVYSETTLGEMLYKYKVDYLSSNINIYDKSDKQSRYTTNHGDYTVKFAKLSALANDTFKIEYISQVNKLPDDVENYANKLSNAADVSQKLMYFIVTMYIVVIFAVMRLLK